MTDTVAETSTAAKPGTMLDQIITTGNMALRDSQKADAAKMLKEFASEARAERLGWNDRGLMVALEQRISQIDQQLSRGLSAVMHAPKFQQLEQSWRGLHQLVTRSETGSRLKIRVANMRKNDLRKDLAKAVDVDQSTLFKKVYEEEYGTFGGNPYSVLVGDYFFDRSSEDIDMLASLAKVAAMAHAPFIAAASPQLFDMRSFTELGVPRDLSKTFESSTMGTWRALRASEDSRYLVLTLPRYLLRLPYGAATKPVEAFGYEEAIETHEDYLWGNAAFLLGQRITDAFSKYGWSAAIRGVEGGGMVEGLPLHAYNTQEGDVAVKCPTEVSITDRREKELNDQGFIAVVHKKNENYAAFFGGQTVNKPIVYNTALANANARLSAQLPCMLAASRFAHYIKVIMRDKVGSFTSRESVEIYLNNWIADYVLVNDNAAQSLKAQYPLREARIDVVDVPGKPGAYRATVFLRPHFQLEELTASIRMVAELPPPVAA